MSNRLTLNLASFALAATVAGCSPSGTDTPSTTERLASAEPTTTAEPPRPPAAAPEKTDRSGTPPVATDKPPKPGPSESPSAKQPASRSLDELLLFHPSKYPNGDWKPKELKFEDVWFEAKDGRRLHGWYCPCEKPRAVVLFAHGNAGNLSHRSSSMRYFQKELRVSSLFFDYRGYGRSEGVPTVEGALQDGRAARTALARRAEVKEAKVVLMGRSLGGAVVVQLAAEAAPRGLILECTFSSLRDVAEHHYPKLSWLVPAKRLDSVAQLARYRGPLLQSHGDADKLVPYALGRKLFEAAKGGQARFVRIPGGDHNDPRSAEYLKALDRFVSELPVE
jgi:fermentation-respiration switch protein FrsA (DUF1100 family)